MKKIFTTAIASLAVAAMLVIGTGAVDFSVSPAATGEVLGDANGDGSINAKDVLSIKRAVVSIESADVGADANADGKLNAKDILAVKRDIVGIEKISDLDGSTVKILAVDGVNINNMAIVAPEGTDPDVDNTAYSAKILREYLARTTGYSRKVEYGTASTAHAIYLILDPTSVGNPTTLEGEAGDLGIEGFTIEVKDGDVYIIGGWYRGCMYGVYEFLEEYVGWRFTDDEGFLYPTDIVNLKSGISDTQIPTVEFRYSGSPVNTYFQKVKMNARQYWSHSSAKDGYVIGPHFINAHSFAYYKADMWPRPGMEGATMSWSEWSSRLGTLNSTWQPCFTSEDSFQEMFQGLLNYSDMIFNDWNQEYVPGQSQFSFSIMDNGNYCQCASCREVYSRIGVSGASCEFAGRAADLYQEYYPGVKLFTILYEHTPYTEGTYVSENLVIMYCGTGCNNHVPGSGECGDNVTSLGGSNAIDEVSLASWCAVSDYVYFWEYGVNYAYCLSPSPTIFNIRQDIQFAIDAGCAGIYYESDEYYDYTFEALKAYIAARVMWDTDMTEEECDALILEYLWIHYGEGYEEIYQIIKLMDEAGDAAGCWINNHDRPWDMYNPEYIAANAEELFALVETAREKASNEDQLALVNSMSMHVYFLTLCATYEDTYVNGDEASRTQYAERYEWLYNYIKDNGFDIFTADEYKLPATCNLDTDPMIQFYETGYSNR